MKAIILAGGLGTRISEETYIKPKPMIEIGNKPIIWHIMKHLSFYGIKDFFICCGYKGEIIKDYFLNYIFNQHDIEIDLVKKSTRVLDKKRDEDWKIQLINTGDTSATGGRLKYLDKYLSKNERFLMTYGDGLSDVNINSLIKLSNQNKNKAIITAVQPKGRFGVLNINKYSLVEKFSEKPDGDGHWVNGGFFILNKSHLKLIKSRNDAWEDKPMKNLTKMKRLIAFKHKGFWKAMDTLSDKKFIENLWNKKKAPWKIWK